MQIILVSRHLKAARTITIMPRHLLAVLVVAALLVFSTSALFSWLSVHLRLPVVENLLVSLYSQESRKTQDYVSNNLNLMPDAWASCRPRYCNWISWASGCRCWPATANRKKRKMASGRVKAAPSCRWR